MHSHALTAESLDLVLEQAVVNLKPKRVAIGEGYHGVHMTLDVYKKSGKGNFEVIGLDDEYREGDVCWLETPLNPTGESRSV